MLALCLGGGRSPGVDHHLRLHVSLRHAVPPPAQGYPAPQEPEEVPTRPRGPETALLGLQRPQNDVTPGAHLHLRYHQHRHQRALCSTGEKQGRFGYRVGQIGPKWDKSGTFVDQISVHFTEVVSDKVPELIYLRQI